MKFLCLDIKNFLTIGEAELELADTGLVVIQGKNEDEPSALSNGAGKSSIPDALMWALFGETARGVTGEQVVNEKAKKNCGVRVDIQDGDSVYRIDRYRKDGTYKNGLFVKVWNPAAEYPLGAGTDITRGTERETQALIVELLGCSREVFQASIYAGQECMPDLPRMTDKQLKLLIEEAAGVERLEKAYELARAKVTETESHLASMRSLAARDEVAIADLKTRHANVTVEYNKFEEGRKGVEALFLEHVEAHAKNIRGLAAELAAMRDGDLTTRRDELTGALAEHSKLLAERDRLQRERDAAERAASMATYQYDNARSEVAKIQKHIADAPANVGKPCRTCSKPHTQEDLAAVVGNLTAQLKEAAKKAAELKGPHEKAVSEAVEAGGRLRKYTESLPDVSAVNAELAEVNAKLAKVADIKNRMRVLKRDYEVCKEKASQALTEPNPNAMALKVLEKQIEDLLKKLRDQVDQAVQLEQELDVNKKVAAIFSPAGVRAHILDTVTPFLNERTSEYLSALSDGNLTATWSTLSTTAKGELREKFNIDCENATGAKSFGGLSGGEKRKVRLATMLALQDLVASRATKPIDIWIGDEIDDALDAAGLERLMGILETKARERGSVLVISHNELSDWADSICTVTKRGGVSTVEGALVAS